MKMQVSLLALALPLAALLVQKGDPHKMGTFPVNGRIRVVPLSGPQGIGEEPFRILKVRIRNPDGSILETTDTTSSGEFQFGAVTQGQYTVSTNDPAFVPRTFPLDFSDPRTTSARVLLMMLTRVDKTKPTQRQMDEVSKLDLASLAAAANRAAVDEMNKGIDLLRNPNSRDSAESHFKKATAAAPAFYEAQLFLGLEQARQTNRSDAIKTLTRAAAVKPSDARAFSALGQLYLEDEQYKKAIDSLTAVRLLGKLSGDDAYILGTAYSMSNNPQAAVPEFGQAIAVGGARLPNAYLALYRTHIRLNQLESAVSVLQGYLRQFPNDQNAAAIVARYQALTEVPEAGSNPVVIPDSPPAETRGAIPAGLSSDRAASSISLDVRLVEVYASVFDQQDRRVQNLEKTDFEVLEDGVRQNIELFEAQESGLSLALLVDTTASMVQLLPHVKNAVAGLLGKLNLDDSVGLFSFSNSLKTLQPFTTNRSAVLTKLIAARADGGTALFDALSQLARDLSRSGGKKVIVLFSDGLDNLSVLNMENATASVRRIGIPVYTIAQGELLQDAQGLKRLKAIAEETNGIAFEARSPADLPAILSKIHEDLQHLYLLGYYPTNTNTSSAWRTIGVRLPRHPELRLRTKEGYYR